MAKYYCKDKSKIIIFIILTLFSVLTNHFLITFFFSSFHTVYEFMIWERINQNEKYSVRVKTVKICLMFQNLDYLKWRFIRVLDVKSVIDFWVNLFQIKTWNASGQLFIANNISIFTFQIDDECDRNELLENCPLKIQNEFWNI